MHRLFVMNKKFVNFCVENSRKLFVEREMKSLLLSKYTTNSIQSVSSRQLPQLNETIIKMSDEIKSALFERKPIVALESTIITHGMPFPHNLQTAINVQKIVREIGVIPATIGVIDGKICVGITDEELQFLANEDGKKGCGNRKLYKISRRDLPVMLANKLSGGTTVSATSLIAYRCGINIFVTGGIGGVHRGGEISFDISADLSELGRTPITIVSGGVKSILDIEKTLEVLESEGVCVVVFNGEEDNDGNVQFPSFFTRVSGCKVGYNLKTTKEAALMISKHEELGLESGILIAVPIPERDKTLGETVNNAISEALKEAKEQNVIGKEVTPFVLKRVNEISGGRSLTANIALIENNARIGSEIALQCSRLINLSTNALSKPSMCLHNRASTLNNNSFFPTQSLKADTVECSEQLKQEWSDPNNNQSQLSPVIIGGSIYDMVANANTESLKLDGSTYKGSLKVSLGGVGRNIFDCLTRLGHFPLFLSAVGNDTYGELIIKNNRMQNNKGIAKLERIPTSSCSIILDGKGECGLLIGDMRSHDYITKEHVSQFHNEICSAPLVILDANIPIDTMIYILKLCSDYEIPVWYEPTDMNVSAKIFGKTTEYHRSLMFMSPNYYELESMANYLFKREQRITQNINHLSLDFLIDNCVKIAKQIMQIYFHTIVITLGKFGVLVVSKAMKDDCLQLGPNSQLFNTIESFPLSPLNAIHFPQQNLENQIISVSGAGDCFASAMIYGLLNKKPLSQSVLIGLKAAKLSLLSSDTIPSDIGTKIHE